MIVAVTGTPGTGKTTATERLRSASETGNGDEEKEGEDEIEDEIEDEDEDARVELDQPLEVVHLNNVLREEDLTTGHDAERDSAIADLGAVREWLVDREDVLVESHLAHHVDADCVIVLRCHPAQIERRLRERGETEASARENAESEALDVILAEAVDRHGRDGVYEIDATDRRPDEVAAEIAAVVAGERKPSAGGVSFTDYL